MGCDIHAFAEIKLNDTWEHVAELKVDRDYNLFSHIGGVRQGVNCKPCPTEDRGVPEDASLFVRWMAASWDSDGHSHSYLNLAEVIDVIQWDIERRKESQYESERNSESFNIKGYPLKWFIQEDLGLEDQFREKVIAVGKDIPIYSGKSKPFDFSKSYRNHKDFEIQDFRIVFWFDN